MTDVFISYSRRDTDFARRLFDALAASGHESWVDWEGIPYSADWWREICVGIDAAETFVFIISPDSMTSMVCNQEMAYARQNNKRIVPVMYRQPEEKMLAGEWFGQEWEATARENWATVKHLNWLFFRTEDDFDSAFAALIETIQQDPEHLRFHTRLLVRAREWDTSQLRDAGLLLRGEDLRQAEGWLEFNRDKAPPPTGLHAHYIHASIEQRKREEEAERRQRQRLRALVAVLSVLLVIVFGVSIFAVDRQRQAESERERADRSSRAARSRELSMASDSTDISIDAALLLDIEALKSEQTTSATSSLLKHLLSFPNLRTILQGHIDQVRDVAISPDGRILATAGVDQQILLWDFATLKPLGQTLIGHTETINALAFSPDGMMLASASEDETVRLWDMIQFQPIGTPLTGHEAAVWTVDFSPDGKTLASGGDDDQIRLWDIATHKVIEPPLIGHDGPIYRVLFSPDGLSLASGGEDMLVYLWDLKTQKPRAIEGHTNWIWSLAFSHNGDILASTGFDNTIRLWDAVTGEALGAPLTGHTNIVRDLAFTSNDAYLLSGGFDGVILQWNVRDIVASTEATATPPTLLLPTLITPPQICDENAVPPCGELASPTSLPDTGFIIFSTPEPGSTQVGDAGEETFGPMQAFIFEATQPNTIELFPTNSGGDIQVQTTGGDANVTLFQDEVIIELDPPQQGDEAVYWGRISNISHSPIWGLAVNTDNQTLVTVGASTDVGVWDLGAKSHLRQNLLIPHEQQTYVRVLAGQPDEGLVVVTADPNNNDKPAFIDYFRQNQPINHIQIPATLGNFVTAAAVSSDSSQPVAAVALGDKHLLWIDTTSGVVLDEINTTDVVYTLAFSPNGQHMASGDNNGSIQLWQMDTDGRWSTYGELLSGHAHRVIALAFAPDNTQLASGSLDSTLILWDVSEPQPMGTPLHGHENAVMTLAFSGDGKTLASGGRDNRIILWDVISAQPKYSPTFHASWVMALAFSPDNTMLASGGRDEAVMLWDLTQAVPSRLGTSIYWHNDWVTALAFSSDGKQLYSGGMDGSLFAMQADVDEWQRAACIIANRDLTVEEQQRFFFYTAYDKTC